MTKLLAGIDVSGRPNVGNYTFMSIVIGTEEKISSMVKNIGSDKIHMHAIQNIKDKNEIISKLKFDRKESIAFCYKIELYTIFQKNKNWHMAYQKNHYGVKSPSVKKFFSAYYYFIWKLIQDSIKAFLQRHNCDQYDITFQSDGDSRRFLNIAGLKSSEVGDAHMLADIVAWGNNKGKEPSGVISVNLVDDIENLSKLKMK